MDSREDVYCTMVLSDHYLPGAAVLAHSLRDLGTQKKLACMIDQENLRHTTITELQSLYNYVVPIERIGNPSPSALYLMNRPDLLYAFSKIALWRMVQWRHIVYLDADTVALRAPDELFDLPDDFAAAPDVGWPDAFNSGVMSLKPNMGDYWALKTLADAGDSFDGADQGLLNQYFEYRPWKRLSFAYNCTPSANYQYEPAYRYYKRDIKMVHFIGREKPWQQGRSVKGAPGAYHELLSRWWAVYDRHFKVSASDYISTGQREPAQQVVQQEVNDESARSDPAYYATGYPVATTQPAPAPSVPSLSEVLATTTEKPFTEPGEHAENIDQGLVEPTPTVQARKFSAPHAEWDATRSAPPAESKPEAANFPTTTYEFNTDPEPFRPPQSYPEPPRDMWYEVPKTPPKTEEKPAPIFPWEEREIPKPTRKFAEDEPLPPPPPEPEPEPDFAGADEFEVQSDDKPEPLTPTTPVIKINDWTAFGATNKNAWDEVAGIENYVRALNTYQKQRSNPQEAARTAQNKAAGVQSPTYQPPLEEKTHILSPTNEPSAEELIEKVTKRRESLILTDFPTAIERPSLPVTPAPKRRATFWGKDAGEEDSGMPPAEGVPNQADWDPAEQLEQLRRNSLIGPGDLKMPGKKSIPDRQMPGSAARIPEETLEEPHVPISGGSSPHGLAIDPFSQTTTGDVNGKNPVPVFEEPDYGPSDTGVDDGVGLQKEAIVDTNLEATKPILKSAAAM